MENYDLIKKLREATGVSLMECKNALEEMGGDFDKAFELMRKKGIAKAEKKAERATGVGRIEAYVHAGNRVGVLLDIRCETDFVARNEVFIELAHEVAMQIAALSPRYVNSDEVPAEVIASERAIFEASMADQKKPKEMLDKIIDGKLAKRFEEMCLLDQPFIKDQTMKVRDIIKNYISKLGENIVVARFTRFEA
ncbi:MAG: elongation factor Ts [Parcubacteria group bacterium]|nr:elongation factor Ts [Parcubacteria group bacterium]